MCSELGLTMPSSTTYAHSRLPQSSLRLLHTRAGRSDAIAACSGGNNRRNTQPSKQRRRCTFRTRKVGHKVCTCAHGAFHILERACVAVDMVQMMSTMQEGLAVCHCKLAAGRPLRPDAGGGPYTPDRTSPPATLQSAALGACGLSCAQPFKACTQHCGRLWSRTCPRMQNQPHGPGARCQASRCACAIKPMPCSTLIAFINPPDTHPVWKGTTLASCSTKTRRVQITGCPAGAPTHHHVSTSRAPMLRMHSSMHLHIVCRLKLNLRKVPRWW